MDGAMEINHDDFFLCGGVGVIRACATCWKERTQPHGVQKVHAERELVKLHMQTQQDRRTTHITTAPIHGMRYRGVQTC